MTEQEAAKLLTLIKASFPSFNLTEAVEELWTRYLTTQTDYENAAANLHEHIMTGEFAPAISQIVKKNENVHAKREKERTRKMLLEQQKMLENIQPPPWEREGLTHREWLHRELAKNRGKRDA